MSRSYSYHDFDFDKPIEEFDREERIEVIEAAAEIDPRLREIVEETQPSDMEGSA